MHFSWQNVLEGQGLEIAATGMLIVFAGLALISLFIARLPQLLALGDRLFTREGAGTASRPVDGETAPASEEEIMAAIALVLHLELEGSTGESGRITISRKQRQGSIWNSAGKMRSLSQGGPFA